MTGRYPTRFGFEFTPAPKAFMRLIEYMNRDALRPPVYFREREKDVPPIEKQGLPPEEITLAELLRERGYRTLGLGKWHLGEAAPMRPTAQGFDEYLGFLQGAALYLPIGDPRSVESVQEFDPIDRFLWANLPSQSRKDEARASSVAYRPTISPRRHAREATQPPSPYYCISVQRPHTPYRRCARIDARGDSETTGAVRGDDRAPNPRRRTRARSAARDGLEENTLVIHQRHGGAITSGAT